MARGKGRTSTILTGAKGLGDNKLTTSKATLLGGQMAIDKKAKKILEKYNTLKAQRQTWEDHWQDVANYFLPRKSRSNTLLVVRILLIF